MSFKRIALWPAAPNAARGQVTKIGAHKSRIVYCNGRTVIIRDLEDPAFAISYAGHVQPTAAASISPTGYYCASGDSVGNVRIWDIAGEENVLKGEYRVLGGKIHDIAWDGESKRIIAVGDGKDKFGHAFMMDSGSSTGEILGHNKTINAVAIRQQRPYRAATASDDRTIVFHSGAPYKYEKSISTHNNFVNGLSYSANGERFASCGADYKVFVYNGTTGDVVAELNGEGGHKGSVSAVSWSPDSKSLVTSSADTTVKLWDVEAQTPVVTWKGWKKGSSDVLSQQVGNAWASTSPDTGIVSLSVNGDLNIFDRRTGDGPVKILHGIQKSVTCATLSSSGTLLAGSADGRVVSFTTSSVGGSPTPLSGDQHSGYVSGITSTPNSIWSVGYDDRVREIVGVSETKNAEEYALSSGSATTSQPKGVAAGGDQAYVAQSNTIEVFKLGGAKVSGLDVKYEATAVAVSSSGVVAVGGQDAKIYLYDSTLKNEVGKLENNRSTITALAFSPDSKLLAAGDSAGRIVLYDAVGKTVITSRWTFHSARINSLTFTSDSLHLASGSLDTDVIVWSVKRPMKHIAIKNAVASGANAVAWLDTGDALAAGKARLSASGADPTIKIWEITFHPPA